MRQINTSLTGLGRVIKALTDAARAARRGTSAVTHIPYRDSRLTFLLEVRPARGRLYHHVEMLLHL